MIRCRCRHAAAADIRLRLCLMRLCRFLLHSYYAVIRHDFIMPTYIMRAISGALLRYAALYCRYAMLPLYMPL